MLRHYYLRIRVNSVALFFCMLLGRSASADSRPPLQPTQIQQWIQACNKGCAASPYAPPPPACRQALESLERTHPGSPELAKLLKSLGSHHRRQNQHVQAEELL